MHTLGYYMQTLGYSGKYCPKYVIIIQREGHDLYEDENIRISNAHSLHFYIQVTPRKETRLYRSTEKQEGLNPAKKQKQLSEPNSSKF